MRTCLLPVMALLATSLLPVEAQNTVRVSSPRIYVFENRDARKTAKITGFR